MRCAAAFPKPCARLGRNTTCPEPQRPGGLPCRAIARKSPAATCAAPPYGDNKCAASAAPAQGLAEAGGRAERGWGRGSLCGLCRARPRALPPALPLQSGSPVHAARTGSRA